MAENLESFVKKLQSEGVDAGREAAEKLRKEAEEKAEEIVARARKEAEEILQEAREEAKRRRALAHSELEMAVRDIVLRLRDSLSRALSAVIAQRVKEEFEDEDYLRKIVRDVVTAYAKGDAGQERQMEVHVSRSMPDDWIRNLLKDLSQQLQITDDAIRVKSTLSRAGFDYRVEGATVEVSPESVTEVLLEMVNPELQEIISRAVADRAA
jgi:V/A-type H+/Na+-transporting ATPase subunit E